MPEQQADHNLVVVIDDLDQLRRYLYDRDPTLGARVVERTAQYLIANRALIDRGVTAWRNTPEDELAALAAQNRELDSSASHHDFYDIGTQVLPAAADIASANPSGVWTIDEDDLNMLTRILRYGKYLTTTSGVTVHREAMEELHHEASNG